MNADAVEEKPWTWLRSRTEHGLTVAAAKARAKRTKEEVDAINDELKKLDKEIDIEGKLLAMSMGITYAGYPVWDTGITSR